MTRVGMERVPHFAHWPNPDGLRSTCHRIHKGRRSADHLFVIRDLQTWAQDHGHRPEAPILDGDFENGGTCTCLQITVQDGKRDTTGLITVVFKGFNSSAGRRIETNRPVKVSWSNRVFGPGVVSPQDLLNRDGYALHLRLDTTDGASDIKIGTRPRKGGIEWAGLDECALGEHGISTPMVTEIRDEMRRNRTIVSISSTQSPEGVQIAPGTTVSRTRFRRALLRIGRKYGMAGETERARLCARLGWQTDHDSPGLPPWLWAEIRSVFGVQAPRVPARPREKWHGKRFTTRLAGRAAERSLVQLDDVIDAIPLSEQLVDFLAEVGCSVYDDINRMRWLRLATVHTSYLHEYGLSEVIDRSVLHGLEELSKRHVQVAVLDSYVHKHQPKKVSQQATQFNANIGHAWEALAALPIFEDAMQLGTGETGLVHERRSRSPVVVLHQIVGIAALLGGHDVVVRLIDRAISSAQVTTAAPEPAIDWRTTLESSTRDLELTEIWEQSGPDHDCTFTLKINDARGRDAEGHGPSKKIAYREAAANFIRRWIPHVLADGVHGDLAARERPKSPQTYEHASHSHYKAVNEILATFQLPQETAPYLAQALTHGSWVHENQREAQAACQRDNKLLAHHGAVVANLLMTHHQVQAVLSQTATPAPGELTMLTPEERIWQELFTKLRLEAALMLSRGQRSDPMPTCADAMQAVLAVAWRAHGSRLLSSRPSILDEWIRANGSIQDASTRLQRVCAIFGIELEYDWHRRGKDHLTEFAATAMLREEDTQLTVDGDWIRGGKTLAKKRCAERVLNVFERITNSDEWNLSGEQRRIAAFLLNSQLKNAIQADKRDLEWCSLQGHLGMSYVLAGDHEAYDAWSQRVRELIGDGPTESDPRLIDFYLRALEAAR